MESFDQAFSKYLQEMPQLFLKEIIKEKFAGQGIEISSEKLDEFLAHVESGTVESFSLDDGDPENKEIDISFTDEDAARLEKLSKDFISDMPKLMESQSDSIAIDFTRILQKNWRKEYSLQKKEISGFRKRLLQRYRKSISNLWLLLTAAREFTQESLSHEDGVDESYLFDVSVRLQTRAFQVTAEIITLLEGGYADGAMARWRTLHEIVVVYAVIKEHGEELARKYTYHEIVDSQRALTLFERSHIELDYPPFPEDEKQNILQKYNEALAEFGPSFKHEYGWAATHLKPNNPDYRPTFADLEAAAGKAVMRSHYKLASNNVHANPKSIFFRLGLLDQQSNLLAGASNAGFVEPVQNCVGTLAELIALMRTKEWNMDELVKIKVIVSLKNEILMSIEEEDKKLREDEEKLR